MTLLKEDANHHLRIRLAREIYKARNPFIKWEDASDAQKIGYYQQVDEIVDWVEKIGYEISQRLSGEEIAKAIANSVGTPSPREGIKADEDSGD